LGLVVKRVETFLKHLESLFQMHMMTLYVVKVELLGIILEAVPKHL